MSITVLHERENQDFRVQLMWDSETDRVYVRVRNRNTRGVFVVEPRPADALDAFYHPFSYAAAAGTDGRIAWEPAVDAQ